MNVKELVGHIQKFEIDNELFHDDLISKVWKSIRTSMYYAFQKELGIFSDVKPRKNLRNKINSVKAVLLNVLFNRPTISAQHKYLVVQHPRTQAIDGLRIDPYSYSFSRNLADASLFVSRSSLGEKNKKLDDDQASLDWLLVLKLLKFKSVDKNDIAHAKKLMFLLCHSLNVDVEKYQKIFISAIRNFLIEEDYFITLLKNNSIETVYLVDHYSKNVPLISACKTLNIKVVEFQHGIISKYHLGYSVSKVDYEWPCYPDLFLSWGEQWLNEVELPSSVDISYIVPAYLKERINVEKKEQLLIVSQSVNGKKIAKFVLQHINMNAFDTILFKLHPSEVDLLPFYENVFKDCKIKVCIENIYPLLSESKYVLGVFSTVMLEAIDFDCQVFYIDLPGSEYISKNRFIINIQHSKYYV
jgi:hypothetical protein